MLGRMLASTLAVILVSDVLFLLLLLHLLLLLLLLPIIIIIIGLNKILFIHRNHKLNK